MDVGMPDDYSLVVDFIGPVGDDQQCWFWLIKAGDATHYKVICDGHCAWSQLPLVLSGLTSVMDAATRSMDGAPGVVAQ